MSFPHSKKEDGSFSVILGLDEGDPETFHISDDHPEYDRIWKAVQQEDADTIREYHTTQSRLQRDFEGTEVELRGGSIYYGKTQIDSRLADEIFDLVEEDEPVEHLVHFLDNLMENPSEKSVDQLYNFVKAYGMQITEEGYLIGYKGVRENYCDCHTNTYKNEVGETHSMPRADVDNNPKHHCSDGFHVGTESYAKGFAPHNGHVMICKLHPKHVVSVPKGHDPAAVQEKIRTQKYEVIGEL